MHQYTLNFDFVSELSTLQRKKRNLERKIDKKNFEKLHPIEKFRFLTPLQGQMKYISRRRNQHTLQRSAITDALT